MNKRIKIIIWVVVVCIMIFLCFHYVFINGYGVTIQNHTNKTLENMEIKFQSGSTIQTIAKIEPKKSWKYTVNTEVIEGENAILLVYKDKKGNPHKETLVGYVEKGYSGRTKLIVRDVDANGIWKVEVKY